MKLKKNIALTSILTVILSLLQISPALAAKLSTTTAVDAITITKTEQTVVVGEEATSTFSVSFSEDGNGTLFGGALVSLDKPAGSNVTVSDADGNGTGTAYIATDTGETDVATSITDSDKDVAGGDQIKMTPANSGGAADNSGDDLVAGTLSITPDVAGTYTITLTGLTDGGGAAAAANAVTDTFVIYVLTTDDILYCATGYVTTVGSCQGVVNGRVQIAMTELDPQTSDLTDGTTYYISVSNATITQVVSDEDYDSNGSSASDFSYGPGSSLSTTAGTVNDWPSSADTNTAADADGLIELGAGDAAEGSETAEYFYITSNTAGTTVIDVFTFNGSGVRTLVETHKVTWLAASNAKISAAESTVTTISATTSCDAAGDFTSNANGAADKAALAAVAKSKMDAADTNGAVAYVCVVARDGNGVLLDNVDVEMSISLGNLNDDETATSSSSSRESLTDMDKTDLLEIYGDADEVGAATITTTLTDESGNSVTLTTPFTFFGDIASVTLTQNTYALGNSDVDADAIYLVAKDKNGVSIPLDEAANGFAADATDLLVDSTYGTVATNADAKGEADDAATVTIADLNSDTTGVEAAEISITCHATVEEKLLITAFGTDDDAVDVKSNTITYYCSDVADKVVITTSASSVAVGGTVGITVQVTDVNGYPVEDGTTVSLATTGSHAVVNGTGASSGTTINGGFAPTKLGTFIAGNSNGPATITAISNGKSASASVTVTGGASSAATQLDALNAKIVALNALIAKIMKKLGVK